MEEIQFYRYKFIINTITFCFPQLGYRFQQKLIFKIIDRTLIEYEKQNAKLVITMCVCVCDLPIIDETKTESEKLTTTLKTKCSNISERIIGNFF